jgi:hypothetical protein
VENFESFRTNRKLRAVAAEDEIDTARQRCRERICRPTATTWLEVEPHAATCIAHLADGRLRDFKRGEFHAGAAYSGTTS